MTHPYFNSEAPALLRSLDAFSLKDAAEALVTAGMAIIAVAPARKEPMLTEAHIKSCAVCQEAGLVGTGRRGQMSTDIASMWKWWSVHPDANIGLPGLANGLLLGDIDAQPGWDWWQARCAEHRFTTMSAPTPGDGERHRLVMRMPDDIEIARLPGAGAAVLDDNGQMVEGLRFYCRLGYVLVPPSIHEKTLTMYGAFSGDIAAAPDWLLSRTQVTSAYEGRGRLAAHQVLSIVDALSHPGIDEDTNSLDRMVARVEHMRTALERHPAMVKAMASAVAFAAEGRLRLRPWTELMLKVYRERIAGDRDADTEFDSVLTWVLSNQFAVDGPGDLFALSMESDVAKEVHRLRVREEARRRFGDDVNVEYPPMLTSAEVIAAGLPDMRWRVAGLMPADSKVALVAQPKVGKTTMTLNLIKHLIEGGDFLDQFEVTPLEDDRTVVVLNYEVAQTQYVRWLEEVGASRERVIPWSLRGLPSPLSTPQRRRRMVELLEQVNCGVLVVDPFINALGGAADPNDNRAVQEFLTYLTEVAVTAGVGEVVIVMHAGWSADDRARGASALAGDPDAIWVLTKGEDGVFFKATGRDVSVDEGLLEYTEADRHMTLVGGSKREHTREQKARKKADEDYNKVLEFVRMQGRLSGPVSLNTVKTDCRLRHAAAVAALERAVAEGVLVESQGQRRARLFSVPGITETEPVTSGSSSPTYSPSASNRHWEHGNRSSVPPVPGNDGDSTPGTSDPEQVETAGTPSYLADFGGGE